MAQYKGDKHDLALRMGVTWKSWLADEQLIPRQRWDYIPRAHRIKQLECP